MNNMNKILIILICFIGVNVNAGFFSSDASQINPTQAPTPIPSPIKIITSDRIGSLHISQLDTWGNVNIYGVYIIEYKGKEYIVNAAGGICPVIESAAKLSE